MGERGNINPANSRSRRLAEVFGEENLSQTLDDLPEHGERDGTRNDAWLRAQVPPHYG